MSAFARFYKDVMASGVATPHDVVRKTWIKNKLDTGLPEGTGSGERAARDLAMYLAGDANIKTLNAVA
jgi:hypothetical protein